MAEVRGAVLSFEVSTACNESSSLFEYHLLDSLVVETREAETDI